MAIQHRALVALSIAFIASIVAFAAFPPDIPRVRYVFIGQLFLAFLLPITATVIWWLLGTLHRSAVRHVPGSLASRAHRPGNGPVPVGVSRHDALLSSGRTCGSAGSWDSWPACS